MRLSQMRRLLLPSLKLMGNKTSMTKLTNPRNLTKLTYLMMVCLMITAIKT